jgi:1,4-dihydroxy-2-naphthoate octaprenyltransferase
MFAKEMDWFLLLPATAIGFLSVAVLNLNNMRDEASDRKSNKNTSIYCTTRISKRSSYLITKSRRFSSVAQLKSRPIKSIIVLKK